MKDKTASCVKSALMAYFMTHMVPNHIYSDSDTSIVSAAEELQKNFQFSFATSPAFTQNRNAVETGWKSLKKFVRNFIYDPASQLDMKNWDIALVYSLDVYNKMPIEKLGISREMIHFNYSVSNLPYVYIDPEPISDTELTTRMQHYLRARLRDYSGKQYPDYKVNDIIYIKSAAPQGTNKTFLAPAQGPLRIIQVHPRRKTVQAVLLGSQKVFTTSFKNITAIPLQDVKIQFFTDWCKNLKPVNRQSRPKKDESIPPLFQSPDQNPKTPKPQNPMKVYNVK